MTFSPRKKDMAQNEAKNPKLKVIGRSIAIIMIGILVILSGAYFAGQSILADNIKSSYQSKDCDQVMEMNTLYTNLYIADKNISKLSKECKLYLLARKSEQKNNKQGIYKAYQTYKRYYPKGLFASEAEEHSALALSDLAKENLGAKEYNDAFENANLIQENFGTTQTTVNANSLIAEIYTTWAKDQRETNDFDKTINTIKEFSAWAQDAKNSEYTDAAQRELSQTYLAWGEMFQSKKQFENAKAKFDLAISTDPKPLSDSGPAIQAKAAQVKLHMAWGDNFLEQGDFTNAIMHYQTSVSLSDLKDQPAAQDQVAEIYLKWAANLSRNEDFLGALKKVEQAKGIAATDGAKKRAETGQEDVYQALSQSTGEQAQQAMKDAAQKICLHQQPELPIFGTDPNKVYAYLDVTPEAKLTNKIRAINPASLHYVACVTQSTKTETEKGAIIKSFEEGPIAGRYFVIERVLHDWNIQLYNLKTGQVVASQLFAGSLPTKSWREMRSYVNDNGITGTTTFAGAPPNIEVVSDWIKTYMK
jgi:tetratricopeptide (TPR) repeat protein